MNDPVATQGQIDAAVAALNRMRKRDAAQVLAEVAPQTSQFVQKIIAFLIAILTDGPAEIKESGQWDKTQDANILGNAYKFEESLNGSVDITATPQ